MLRRTEFIGLRIKVRLHNESYAWVPEAGGFNKAPKREGFFLLWFIFYPKGCVVMYFPLRGCLAEFQNMEMLPYFDPTHWLDFMIDF